MERRIPWRGRSLARGELVPSSFVRFWENGLVLVQVDATHWGCAASESYDTGQFTNLAERH